MLNRTYVT